MNHATSVKRSLFITILTNLVYPTVPDYLYLDPSFGKPSSPALPTTEKFFKWSQKNSYTRTTIKVYLKGSRSKRLFVPDVTDESEGRPLVNLLDEQVFELTLNSLNPALQKWKVAFAFKITILFFFFPSIWNQLR